MVSSLATSDERRATSDEDRDTDFTVETAETAER
jgi:hypothetical protein